MTVNRRRRRRPSLTVVVAGVALFAAACSVEQSLPMPNCVTGDSGLIVAQSVPTADLLPCLDPLPEGWEQAAVRIDQDGTSIRLDSDRAGAGAAHLRYADVCDIEDAVPVPSDQEGADRFDRPERLEPGFREQRYYVFPGGCVWWEFDFDDGVSATLSIELGDRLTLLTRDWLNQNIRESFIDREL